MGVVTEVKVGDSFYAKTTIKTEKGETGAFVAGFATGGLLVGAAAVALYASFQNQQK